MDVLIELAHQSRLVVRSSCGAEKEWRLAHAYTEVSTTASMLEKGVVVGKTREGTLHLIRLSAGTEEEVAGGTLAFATSGLSVVYASGRGLRLYDFSRGEELELIPASEISCVAEEMRILSSGHVIVFLNGRVIHTYDTASNVHMRIKMKIRISKEAAGISAAEAGGPGFIGISCDKGNVYLLDTRTLKLVKSMKNLGGPVVALGFWPAEGEGLLMITDNNDAIHVDYKQNKAIRKVRIEGYKITGACLIDNEKAVLLSSSGWLVSLDYGTGKVSPMWQLSSPCAPASGKFCVVESRRACAPSEEGADENVPGNISPSPTSAQDPGAGPSCKEPALSAAKGGALKRDEGEAHAVTKAFDAFKDSMYKMQAETFRELFVLKKRVEELESRIFERAPGRLPGKQ